MKTAPAMQGEGHRTNQEIQMQDISRHSGSAASPFDAIRREDGDGREYWSARDLMPLLGYPTWQHFMPAIDRARTAAEAQGHELTGLFTPNREKSGGRPREDFDLARFACYLVAMNGDPRKPEVAAAQAYFAIRTREAETSTPKLEGPELLAAAVLESQRVIEARDARIFQLEAAQTAAAPKVSYVDTYVTDEDLLSFSTVASANRIKEKDLRDLLIAKDWIYQQEESRWSNSKGKKVVRYRYTEKASHKRYFRRVEVHEAPRFRGEVMHTLKITPQGAEAIARLIAKGQAA